MIKTPPFMSFVNNNNRTVGLFTHAFRMRKQTFTANKQKWCYEYVKIDSNDFYYISLSFPNIRCSPFLLFLFIRHSISKELNVYDIKNFWLEIVLFVNWHYLIG